MKSVDEMIFELEAAGWGVNRLECERYDGTGDWSAHAGKRLRSGSQEFRAGYGATLQLALQALCRDCLGWEQQPT